MAAAAKRVVVVGGVAGGASAAARLRRLTEAAHITIFERNTVSYANCGLPYYVGNVIDVSGGLRLSIDSMQRPAASQKLNQARTQKLNQACMHADQGFVLSHHHQKHPTAPTRP